VDAPPTGWVTVLAGLLARGSLPHAGLPSFPVAVTDVRLAADSCGGSHGLHRHRRLAVFPLSSPASAGEPARSKASSYRRF